ncbi:potassium channel [Coprinopsis cinerea okayama7|uniref:Potassium channel n=1 Tax=Coprinopsis cinerea (strain Okayama-7 / 130 / ATCC MYA-4618 / FGSC 9003) TaxID=240176 RepID=D6RPE6_COPC7|nr:potassium channel [Coprinopsis cinerea okayama7\|eukprot:XP_002910745.1 potassium channel [Coprinopsis cinerea okayama7\
MASAGSSDPEFSFSRRRLTRGRRASKHDITQGPDKPKVFKVLSLVEGTERVEHSDEVYHQPTVWWFTSTAFPLIAGAFGPIANLFSVCSLTQTWRIRRSDYARVRDPVWLISLNSVSLWFALNANILLLLGFSRRIPYKVAQPGAIALWYASSVLLFVPLGILGTTLLHSETEALSQSWYYGLISGALYFTMSSLLLFNMIGAHWFRAYPASFAILSISQRTLMLETITFSLHLALMAGVFSALEGWDYVDALYWADYTVLTIGLGSDFPVETTAGRMVVIPFSAVGILLLGLVVRSVRGLVLERAKVKVLKRRLGKQREKWRRYIRRKREERKFAGKDGGAQEKLKRMNLYPAFARTAWAWWRQVDRAPNGDLGGALLRGEQVEPWSKDEFDLMRFIEASSEKMERYTLFSIALVTFCIVWIIGSLVFWASEHGNQHWTYTIALYFSYVSITTIGYGDFFPTPPAGRPFFVIWSLIAIPTVTVLIASMGNTIVDFVTHITFLLGRYTILPEKHPVEELERDARREKAGRARVGIARRATMSAEDSRSVMSSWNDTDIPHPDRIARSESEGTIQETDIMFRKLWAQRRRCARMAMRISQEIVFLAQDLRVHPRKKYTWEEWVNWLEVFREPVMFLPSLHPGAPLSHEHHRHGVQAKSVSKLDIFRSRRARARSVPDPRDPRSHWLWFRGNGDDGVPAAVDDPTGRGEDEEDDGTDFDWEPTWLSDAGPLFSAETETEWIMDRLNLRLEGILKDVTTLDHQLTVRGLWTSVMADERR